MACETRVRSPVILFSEILFSGIDELSILDI